MKSDARLLLNKKKWKTVTRNTNSWSNQRGLKSRTVDARKILNLKRSQKPKTVLGSYMRTQAATAFIASQIRKEISPAYKVPDKKVQMSRDGNLIITSKSKNSSWTANKREIAQKMEIDLPSRNTFLQKTTIRHGPSSSSLDDLEHTAIEDLLDVDSLPPAYVSSKSFPSADLSRKSLASQVLEKRNTMVADQLVQPSRPLSAKVFVSNLHPSVSKQDVMELFGDVGLIKDAEMLMPGTAIIGFYDASDAGKACEIYHNRLLDGLPMKCYLQNNSRPQRSAISQRLGERVAPSPPVEIPSAPSVSSNPRYRYNSRNVQFTVKLT